MLRAHTPITLIISTPGTTLHPLTARLALPRPRIINYLLVRNIAILCSPTSSPARSTARFLVRGERVSVLGGTGRVRGQIDDGGNDGRRLRGFFSL
jgi:hypothetical protein